MTMDYIYVGDGGPRAYTFILNYVIMIKSQFMIFINSYVEQNKYNACMNFEIDGSGWEGGLNFFFFFFFFQV